MLSTNLWIPLSHHICLTYKNLAHIFADGTKRFPLLIQLQKGADWHVKNEMAMIGHFQKTRLVGKLGIGMSGMQPDTG